MHHLYSAILRAMVYLLNYLGGSHSYSIPPRIDRSEGISIYTHILLRIWLAAIIRSMCDLVTCVTYYL